jgi:hypothetical protein
MHELYLILVSQPSLCLRTQLNANDLFHYLPETLHYLTMDIKSETKCSAQVGHLSCHPSPYSLKFLYIQ